MRHVVLLKSRAGNQGGLEKYAARIAQAFVNRGAKVSLLTTGDEVQDPKICLFSTKTIPWPAFIRMEQFDRFVTQWLKKNRADLVFGMDRNRFQTHIRAGNGVHAAYLQSRVFTEGPLKALLCQWNPLHLKILELEKAAFENPQLQKLFTNSYLVRDQVLNFYRVDPAKIQVIHNGVEWAEMQTQFNGWEQERKRALNAFQLSSDHYHFLFIGHGYRRKGLDSLLTALSRLKRDDVHLSVVGKDNKIDLYRAKAKQLGIQNQVRFFGPSDQTHLFYQLADCLVIPSFYDPFANVTVEALAMGLFVVSSKQNGGSEILTPQTGAIIEDLLNPDTLTEALNIALKTPKTKEQAEKTRLSVKHLDFSHQMHALMEYCG